MKSILIKTDDIYHLELSARSEACYELLYRIPADDGLSFDASLLKNYDSLVLIKSVVSKATQNRADHEFIETKNNSREQIAKRLSDLVKQERFSAATMDEQHCYPRPKGIIFDLDGTLIDSEPNYYESDRLLMEEYGVVFTEEMKKKYIGVGNSFMMDDLKRTYSFSDPMEVLLEKKNRYYMEIARRNTKAFPEMKRLVEQLAARGLPLAIASGSSPEVIEELTEIVGLRKYFKELVSSEEVRRGKPAPDIFLEAAHRLGIRPVEGIVLEDTQYGVEAAVRAGMRCVAIPTITDPLDRNFIMADLLFAEGMDSFDAEAFFRWLESY